MTNTDPLTDFTQLISDNVSINQEIALETPTKSDEYLKELELNNFQTRQLFDELLQQEESPNFISSVQKDQRIMNTHLRLSDQQNVCLITDIPHLTYIEVEKTRKIFKQRKMPQNSTHQNSQFGLFPREKQRLTSKMTHNRLRFRIQQNDQQQKLIQTTQLKRRNGGKLKESQVQIVKREVNQSCSQLVSEVKQFGCEQFQNYLNLS